MKAIVVGDVGGGERGLRSERVMMGRAVRCCTKTGGGGVEI